MKKLLKGAAVISAAVLLTGCQTEGPGNIRLGELISNMYVDANATDPGSSVPETGDAASVTEEDPTVQEPLEEPEGGHLTILSWEGNSDIPNMVENFIANSQYSENDIEIINCGDYSENARDSYSQKILSGSADIIVLDIDFADQYFDSGYCMPLSDIGLFRSDFSEAFDYSLDLGTSSDGVFMGASPYICPGGFVYRADLAREYLGVSSPEEMQNLIGSWDKFTDTARKLYSASGQKVSLASTYSGIWLAYNNSALPWVDSGDRLNYSYSAEHFFDIVDSLKYNGGVYGAAQWDREWYDSISGGYALGEFLPTWGLMDTEYSQLGQMCGNGEYEMAFCKGPSAYYWGGTMFAAASSCDDPTMAREFIEYTCINTDSMYEYAKQNDSAFMNNRSVVNAMNPYNSLLRGENYYEWLIESAEEISVAGHTQYDAVISSNFNDCVTGYIDGTYTTRDNAVSEFKSEVSIDFPNLIVE